MQWNVFRCGFNDNKIVTYDIFKHGSFNENVKKLLKQHSNKDAFAKDLKKELMFYFWCKCEHEVVVTSWPPRIKPNELDRLNADFKKDSEKYGHPPYSICIRPECGEKVDIYSQVMLNWEIFCDYVWSHKHKTKKEV